MGSADAAEKKRQHVKGVSPTIGLVARGEPHAVTKGLKKGSVELGARIVNTRGRVGSYWPWPTDPQSAVPYGLLHLCGATARHCHAKSGGLAADDGLKAPSLSDRCVPLVVSHVRF